jgi:tRNA G18 (ribose-2'-O)-methylase SpoU
VVITVSALSDPRLDDYRNVPDPELLRSRGIFVAEGRLVVRRLLETPHFQTRSVLLTHAAYEALTGVMHALPDLPVYVVSQRTMNEITGFNIHRGCLAIGERPAAMPWTELVREASLTLVLERVSNADNVGGVFRSAAAFGADCVLLGPACADPLYRKAIRTSMGAVLQVPFAAMPEWPDDLVRLRAAGFRLVALTPANDAIPLRDAATVGRAALLVGHEGEGLSAEALAAADVRACIPIAAGVDSLNVAAAASIALYELASQRSRSAPAETGIVDQRGTDPTLDRRAGK